MARQSVAAAVAAEHAIAPAPMEPPSYLTAEEAAEWRTLVDAGRLGVDQGPLLAALVLAMSRSSRLAAALATMDGKSLAGSSKAGRETRDVFLRLASASVAEAKLVSALSTKLRFSKQSAVRSVTADRERERVGSGPRPWDTAERHN
jgi:hypothetical protein